MSPTRQQKKRCKHCRGLFNSDPRVKDQKYCSDKRCQRARKTLWQKQKLATDPDYQANQKDSQKRWRENNPDYWRNYRDQNPDYVKRNRILQTERNAKKRSIKMIAKKDMIKKKLSIKSGSYFIIPSPVKEIANMDVSGQKVHIISST